MIRARVPALYALALALAACGGSQPGVVVGVRVNDGALEVHYVRCRDESVQRVRVVVPHGEVGDEDDETLWDVFAAGGSEQEVFIPGEAPPGFAERTELERPPPPGTDLAAVVTTSLAPSAVVRFRIDDLPAGRVLAGDGREFTVNGFRSRADAVCPG